MTPRLAVLGAALTAFLAGLAGGPATGPFGLDWPDWPDWGEKLELSDLRHAVEVHPPVAVERWLWNPRERTAEGLRRLEAEGPEAALATFERAGRLAPDDREVLFNLGTARLLADYGDAVGALERAVAAPDPESDQESDPEGPVAAPPPDRPLRPETLQRAWYNLGIARLAADRPGGAVAAFEEALRREPSDADAKFNLELALRRLEERDRRGLLPPRESAGGDRPGEEPPSEEPGGTETGTSPEGDDGGGRDARRPRDEGGEGAETEAETETERGERSGEGAPAGRRPLAGFEEQQDLTAAQAGALLDAVEDLERRQRRLEAAQSARSAGAAEEDW